MPGLPRVPGQRMSINAVLGPQRPRELSRLRLITTRQRCQLCGTPGRCGGLVKAQRITFDQDNFSKMLAQRSRDGEPRHASADDDRSVVACVTQADVRLKDQLALTSDVQTDDAGRARLALAV